MSNFDIEELKSNMFHQMVRDLDVPAMRETSAGRIAILPWPAKDKKAFMKRQKRMLDALQELQEAHNDARVFFENTGRTYAKKAHANK